MKRRAFMAGLGSAAAWPLVARAQQVAIPVIGLLNGVSNEDYADWITSIRQGLLQQGFVEGRNVAIEYRSAEGRYDRLPALATDLVRRQVAATIAIGSTNGAIECRSRRWGRSSCKIDNAQTRRCRRNTASRTD